MSPQKMKKYNIKSYKKLQDYILITDNTGDEWMIKNSTLYHLSTRNSRGNISYHKQCDIKDITHALSYISSHTRKYLQPARKCRIQYLFDLI